MTFKAHEAVSPPDRRVASTAFTLVELLVVIAIVGILGTFLLTALTGIREKMGAAKCLNNMRQIGIALTLYANEHGGYYPARYDEDGGTWRQKLNSYLGLSSKDIYSRNKVWFCPSAKIMPESLAPLVCHYGYNYVITGGLWRRRMAAPPNPAKQVLMGEMNRNNDSTSYAQAPCFVGDAMTSNRFSHPGHTGNFLFVDGHVEAIHYVDSKNPPAEIFIWW